MFAATTRAYSSANTPALAHGRRRRVRGHAHQQVVGGVIQLEENPPRGGVYLHGDLLPVELYPPFFQHLDEGGTYVGARHKHRLVLGGVEGYLRPPADA